MNWINVKHRLPEIGRPVIVASKITAMAVDHDEYAVAYHNGKIDRYGEHEWIVANNGLSNENGSYERVLLSYDPTHWFEFELLE